MKTKTIKIAHLSDLHFLYGPAFAYNLALTIGSGVLLALGNNKDSESAQILGAAGLTYSLWRSRLLASQMHRYIYSLKSSRLALLADLSAHKPDHIIITGDLTTVGHPKEFERAKQYIEKLQSICGSDSITIIPGNHDVSNDIIDKLWRPDNKLYYYLEYFKKYHTMTGNYFFPFTKKLGELFIVGLDSSGRDLALGGKVSSEQVERTAEIYQSSIARESFKLLLLHHHIHHRSIPFIPDLLIKNFVDLSNSREIISLAQESQIDCILHGHIHEKYKESDDLSLIRCAGMTLLPEKEKDEKSICYDMLIWENGKMTIEEHSIPIA
jgi:3',5'-cyclic AMP phosphodiesterase CpdA